MKRTIYLLTINLIVVGLLFSLVGCSGKKTVNLIEDDQNFAEQSIDQVKDENVVESEAKFIAPLTGLPADKELNQRIIGVMINNHSKARPQSGLNQADIVYELLAEGMITRFVAIYHSHEMNIIGPVRSIRPYYLDVINGFDALIVHAGSSQAALTLLQHSSLPDLDEIENAGAAFWRASFRKAPHNVYTSTEKIREVAEKRGYKSEGYIPTILFLNEESEFMGEQVVDLEIKYSSDYIVSYSFDENTKLYDRFINQKPHTDLETNSQLTAKNILVIESYHKILDNVGRRSIDVYGPGKGLLFQNGKVKEINWERKDGIIRPYINGAEQGLLPGQTWVIIVPNLKDVSFK